MLILPLGYRAQEIRDLSAANGGSPYGASVLGNGLGKRPTQNELGAARIQGRALTETVQKLFA